MPNRLCVGDPSYLGGWEGVVYFAFVIDPFSRRVVGWQLASHMRDTLVLDALRMALGTRGNGADFQLVAYSDRCSQYTSIGCAQALADHRVLASVGSGGDAYDKRTRAYAERRAREGKTQREIMRYIAREIMRYIAREVYNALRADLADTSHPKPAVATTILCGSPGFGITRKRT